MKQACKSLPQVFPSDSVSPLSLPKLKQTQELNGQENGTAVHTQTFADRCFFFILNERRGKRDESFAGCEGWDSSGHYWICIRLM